ncbi:MAG: glycogen debranching protein GlgX [Thermoguttaceae bacterium]|nr:glycogen debranching protein GlgX [Thermoguttaceae bacterium]
MMVKNPPSLKFSYPLPYGALYRDGGVIFSVVSRHATAVRLLLYDRVTDLEPSDVIHFDKDANRWGDVWSIFLRNIPAGQLYHFQVDGPHSPSKGSYFDPKARLIDPYAKALAGDFLPSHDGIVRPPKCVVVDNSFDWTGERHLRRDLSETIIYELHVKGFTCSANSSVASPGTYLGLIEKIPYLKSLGVTAVELMPVHEFPTNETDGTRKPNHNYWGYDSLAFFSPHRGYASDKRPGAQVEEFKKMVLAFHQAGIEVILDVVFNHTSEGNERGPILSFKGLDNRAYYMLDPGGQYKNYSGCGNTVNGNHPLMRELIFNCLRYWVHNYHVDGFRFDLASILSRDRKGNLVANPPVLETISEDPMLADTKIIAEAWDAAGAYQVGSFGSGRWAEWNGRFRDDIRRFWRGDTYMTGPFATRISGSSDLYQANGRTPASSINFVTSHDGFTLNDLVSYNYKHNDSNGENNRDGDNNNFSCNYGEEGPTTRPEIEAIRQRQMKNMFATLLLSQGVPMISAGDEIRRTQQGNNNAYCQDNALSWFDWNLAKRNDKLYRFCSALIEFRKREGTVRQKYFFCGQPRCAGGIPDISWYSPDGGEVHWNDPATHAMSCLLARAADDPTAKYHVLILANGNWNPVTFAYPAICQHRSFQWRLFVDTAADSPKDVYPAYDGPEPNMKTSVTLVPHSLKVYLATEE